MILLMVRKDNRGRQIEADCQSDRCRKPNKVNRNGLERRPSVDPDRADGNEDENGQEGGLGFKSPESASTDQSGKATEQLCQCKPENQTVKNDEIAEPVQNPPLACIVAEAR